MKRLFLIVALTATVAGIRGQDNGFWMGPESHDLEADMMVNAHYLGALEGLDVWLTRSDKGVKGFANKRDWHVVKFTEEMLPMERVELPWSQHCKVLGAVGAEKNINGIHRASVLMVDSSVMGKTAILRARLSLDMMRLEGGKLDTVDTYVFGRKDLCRVWGAVSPNGKYVGVLTIVQYMESHEYMAVAKVFDENLKQVWVKDFAVGATNGIYLDDDGTMYTLGSERAKNGSRFVMSVMNKAGANTFGVLMECDPVHDVGIVNVTEGNVLCTGLFTLVTAEPGMDLTSGVVTMSFNVDSTQMEGFSMRFFQNEDMNIMLNKKTKKIQTERDMSMVAPLGSLRMPYGAVMVVGHHHALHRTNPNGTRDDSWYAVGLHLVAFNANGTLKWVRNIRRNDMTDLADEWLNLHLFAVGDKVCLLKNESIKEPQEYIIADEIREYEVGDKSNLVMYTITAEGNVKKTILEQETKHALANIGHRDDGSLLLLSARGSKCRMAKLKLDK